MFCVEPWKRMIGVEGGGPEETTVWLEFHAEERVGETSEIVVIDTCVNEGGRDTNLFAVGQKSLKSTEILRCGFRLPLPTKKE